MGVLPRPPPLTPVAGLDQIQVPIQIWHGEDDRLVSPQASRILAAALLLATRHSVPEAGHFMIADDVDNILQSIL